MSAGKYGVLPIDGSGLTRVAAEKPLVAPQRQPYRYYPGTQSSAAGFHLASSRYPVR